VRGAIASESGDGGVGAPEGRGMEAAVRVHLGLGAGVESLRRALEEEGEAYASGCGRRTRSSRPRGGLEGKAGLGTGWGEGK